MSGTSAILLAEEQRLWKSEFTGCCDYKNPKGDCMWCPFFVPMSVCGTCMVIGRLETKLAGEDACCCDMGPRGAFCCFVSNALLGPVGFMLLGCCIRTRVIKKYNVNTDKENICKKLCFPCSYFQMWVSTKEWDDEAKVKTVQAVPTGK
jgi:hypothetical protein